MDKLYISTGKCIRIMFLLVAVWLLPSSCVMDGEETPARGQTDVNITIKLPNETATRALGTADENEVKTVDVLVFDAVTHGFLYMAFGHNITGSGTTRTFSVMLPESTGNVDMDFVVNARPWIAAGYPSGIAAGTLRADVQKALAATISSRWIADKTDPGYMPLPMWGSRDGVTVNQALATSGIGTIDVVRMLAAVNIELSAAAQTSFRLEYVYLYNYNTKGLLKPDTETAGLWNSTLHRAIHPSLPPVPGSIKGPLVFDNSDPLDDKTRYTGEIYLFEAENGAAPDYPDIPCLVIGGKYLGPDGLSTPQDAFYRVDLTSVDSFGNITYLDILRNHKYTVTVNSVNSSGLPDEDEAYNSVRADIQVSITDWDLGGNVVLDPTGQRYLWLSDLEFEANPDGETFTMTIDTDATTWKAVVSDSDVNPNAGGATWLTVSPATGGAGTNTLTITASRNDEIGPYRYGSLHMITDNRLDAVVKVVQDGYDFDIETTHTQNETIPRTGSSYIVTVSGTSWPLLYVRAQVAVTSTVVAPQVSIVAGGPGLDNTQTLTLIPNDSWASRTVEFRWSKDGNLWTGPITTGTQPGQTITGASISHTGIGGEGGDVTVTVAGDYSHDLVEVRAINATNGNAELVSAVMEPGGSVILSIPGNVSATPRNVTFQYRRNVNGSWEPWGTHIETIPQGKNPVVLSTGRIVADNDALRDGMTGAETMNWAEAMGVSSMYLISDYYKTYSGGTMTNMYYPHQTGITTGCAGYYEPYTPYAVWRVPTFDECKEMYTKVYSIGNMNRDTAIGYWASQETMAANLVYAFSMVNGQIVNYGTSKQTYKRDNHWVRCVRD